MNEKGIFGKESMKMKNKTQLGEILKYMLSHKGITRLQALDKFGCINLPDVIWKLRREGYEIENEYITKKNRYGHTTTFVRYCIVK